MKFPILILRAAQEEFERRGDLLGLRLSPVRIEKAEAIALFEQAASVLGDKVYVAISAPGVEARLEGRRFIAPDERTAEKATEWRNEAHPSQGEHLLYVSTEIYGRAGGLTDCLHELNEQALRTEFRRWCESRDSVFPAAFADVLDSTGLLEVVSSHQLCQFAEDVARRCDAGRRPWEAIGLSLGTMHLASDTQLRAADAVERIRANRELVTRVSTSERQNASRQEEHGQILDDLGRAVRGHRDLSAVDLGPIGTGSLTKAAGIRPLLSGKKRLSTKQMKAKAREKSRRPPDGKATREMSALAAHQLEASEGIAPELQFINAALNSTTESRVEETRKHAARLLANPSIWTERAQRSEFQGYRHISTSLLNLLVLSAQSDGAQQTWLVRGDPTSVERQLPTAHEHSSGSLPNDALRDACATWKATRSALVGELTLNDASAARAYHRFIDAPLLTLHSEDLRGAIRRHLASSTDLLTQAAALGDAEAAITVLNLETVLVRSRSGPAYLALSPLHPLWLSQIAARYRALVEEPDLDNTARALLAWSLVTSPAAPPSWPLATSEWLERATGRTSMVTYQSRTESSETSSVREAVDKLLARYVDMHPHANLGLHVEVAGRGASGALEGVAAFLERNATTKKAWLHSDTSLEVRSTTAVSQMEEGRLLLVPVQRQQERRHVHVALVVDPAPPEPQFDEPVAPRAIGHTGGVGTLPTQFAIRGGALYVETPLEGHPELQAIECLVAGLENRTPRGAFAYRGHSVAMSAVLSGAPTASVTWNAVIASRLSARPPVGYHLLLHERVAEGCEIGAVTTNIGPTGRWLEKTLCGIGVQDLRPRTLQHLAGVLANAGGRGLVSLDGGSGQLLAAGLLGLSLRKVAGENDVLVAPIDGNSYRTLLGRDPGKDGSTAVMLSLFVRKGVLNVEVGMASTEELDLAVRGEHFGGGMGKGLQRLIATIRLACESRSLGGSAAREELSWVLWPALASTNRTGSLETLVRMIQPSVQYAIGVHVLVPSSPASSSFKNATRRLSLPVTVTPLNVETLENLMLST